MEGLPGEGGRHTLPPQTTLNTRNDLGPWNVPLPSLSYSALQTGVFFRGVGRDRGGARWSVLGFLILF